MKSKKSQGLSFNIIIIAAIALVALIVILAIFTNFTGKTAQNIGSCTAKGGKCAQDNGGSCGNNGYVIPLIVSGDCKSSVEKLNNLCCLKFGN